MPELTTPPSMHDKTILFNDYESKTKALTVIQKIKQSANFFEELIRQFEPRKSDAFVHLGLLESYLTELSKLTGYDGMVIQENKRRYAELKAANDRIRELEKQIGNQVSTEAVSTGIRRWENIFCAWYEAHGFRYADVEMGPYVIRAEFSEELVNAPRARHLSDEELFNELVNCVPFITDNPDWDIEHGQFHSNLLDTKANKLNLIQLFKDAFPNANIHEFKARKDGEQYYLRFSVAIPWSDLGAWYKKLPAENQDRNAESQDGNAESQDENAESQDGSAES